MCIHVYVPASKPIALLAKTYFLVFDDLGLIVFRCLPSDCFEAGLHVLHDGVLQILFALDLIAVLGLAGQVDLNAVGCIQLMTLCSLELVDFLGLFLGLVRLL